MSVKWFSELNFQDWNTKVSKCADGIREGLLCMREEGTDEEGWGTKREEGVIDMAVDDDKWEIYNEEERDNLWGGTDHEK